MLLLNIVVLIAGFFALIKGADVFVDGSAALAKNFKIPTLIIGLTVVAMGTSAPELAVSVSAGLQGANEIAFSNVVGSNLFNLLGVLGVCAVISPLPVGPVALKRDYPVSIAVTLFVLAAVGGNAILSGELFKSGMYDNVGAVTRPVAGILLAVFAAYILYLIIDAKRNPAPDDGEIAKMSNMKCFAFIVIGLVLIVVGGKAVVYAARELALAAGVSETLVGLTVVALGTSLPELVTSIVAAKKGEMDLAVGNVIGSNIFNIMLILGVSASLRPIAVNAASVYDTAILAAVSILAYISCVSRRRINRIEGVVFLAAYTAAVVFAAVR